jgi:hypothetical protein
MSQPESVMQAQVTSATEETRKIFKSSGNKYAFCGQKLQEKLSLYFNERWQF